MAYGEEISRRGMLHGAASIAGIVAVPSFAKGDGQLPLEPKCSRFRVLSLDGGGARGYLTALILRNLEIYLDHATKVRKPLGQRFDFLVGTSTGGIIALGLATGKTAAEIAGFYETLIPRVFSKEAQRYWLSRLYYPKYESDNLKAAIENLFGSATLEDVQTDVCITGVALQSGRPRFYKSLYQAANIPRAKERLSDIALATSAAPTYFEARHLAFSEKIIDGGICANNPSVVAIVDALRFERPSITNGAITKNISDIRLVSVGTGEQPSMPYDADALANAGLLDWAQFISDAMFESQSVVADVQAGFLLPGNYLRINPKLSAAMPLDDATHLNDFKNISDLNHGHEILIKKFFLDEAGCP